MSTKKPEQMQLYTIRLQPAVIKRLHALAKKQGVTNAEVARAALAKGMPKP
jgi:predicted DNA-binding protein